MERLPASMLQDLSKACEWAFTAPFSKNPGSGGLLAAVRFVDAFRRCGILHELFDGTARPRNELTRAVGAHAAEHFARAGAAERALEGANEGLGGVGREIAVTALAVRTELQHFLPPSLDRRAVAHPFSSADVRREALTLYLGDVLAASTSAGASRRVAPLCQLRALGALERDQSSGCRFLLVLAPGRPG